MVTHPTTPTLIRERLELFAPCSLPTPAPFRTYYDPSELPSYPELFSSPFIPLASRKDSFDAAMRIEGWLARLRAARHTHN